MIESILPRTKSAEKKSLQKTKAAVQRLLFQLSMKHLFFTQIPLWLKTQIPHQLMALQLKRMWLRIQRPQWQPQ